MHREAGVTLIEVVVTAMIFAVALVTLGGMQVLVIQLNAKAKRSTQLAAIAQQRLEALFALPYSDATLQDHTPAESITKSTYTAPQPLQGYTVQWMVKDHVITPQYTIKAIDVTVTSTLTGGREHSLTLSGARSSLSP